MKNKRITQFFLYQIRKGTTFINFPVCQEIRLTNYFFLYSQENSLHNVFHIHKSQILTTETDREINVFLDRLCHQIVISFTRSIDSCRTINDIRETGHTLNIQLRFQLAQSISSIGYRRVVRFYRSIVLLTYRSEHTQCTDIDKLFRNHIQLLQRIDKIFGLKIIHIVKRVLVGALCNTGAMNDIIKFVVSAFMPGELGTKFIRVRKIQFQKVDFPVFQIPLATRRTNPGPHTKLSLQRFLHDETADKTTRACN